MIRILVLEDNCLDAELMIYELRRAGIELEWKLAENRESFENALNDPFDVILADYSLPQFDAMKALEMLKERHLGIPLIVVSGSIGEEKAAQTIKAGAKDYLLKDRIKRLAPAVQRVIEEEVLRTAKAETDHALHVSEKRFRLAVDNIPHPITIHDRELRIQFANQASVDLYGCPQTSIIGRKDQELLPTEFTDQYLPVMNAARESGSRRRIECSFALPKGISHYDINYVPLHEETGELRELLSIAFDVTEHRKIMQRKDDMLSAVSHEMCTPLTAMIGFAEILQQNPQDESLRTEATATILKEGERLQHLIDNLLGLQRIKAGFYNDCEETIEIEPFLEKALHKFSGPTCRHNLRIECPNDLVPLWGKEEALLHAVENLLKNAVQHAPEDTTITVRASAGPGNILLSVTDQGPGIPKDILEDIFSHFVRHDKISGKPLGGTGLGLRFVKQVINDHGGKAWANSEMGQGSTFFIQIPLKGCRMMQEGTDA